MKCMEILLEMLLNLDLKEPNLIIKVDLALPHLSTLIGRGRLFPGQSIPAHPHQVRFR